MGRENAIETFGHNGSATRRTEKRDTTTGSGAGQSGGKAEARTVKEEETSKTGCAQGNEGNVTDQRGETRNNR